MQFSVLLKLGRCKNEYTPLKVSGAKLNFRLQMSNLTRIQPQVSLIIHYTGVQQTVDYKRVLLKETPSHFMLSAMRKKIISLHKKGEGYKKISKAVLISQNTVAKVVQTFKKDGTATISQRRPGRPRKLTPRQEHLLMRRV